MKLLPSIHRIVPAHAAVKLEWVFPYDNMKAILTRSKVLHMSEHVYRI